MVRPFSLVFVLALALVAGFTATAHADLDVVTTTSDLAAITKEIGGEHVDVTALSLPTQDPHFVDPRPHFALALSRADLLIAIGLGLEVGWLPTLQTAARNGDIQRGGRGYLEAAAHVAPLAVPAGRVDRSQGDIHPGGSPHFMLDPRRVARVARAIGERLATLDPGHRAAYESGTQRFVERLEQARAGWERELSALRGKKLIAYHASFAYLADWLGFDVAEHIEPRPGIPPNPHHVAHVLGAARRHDVKIILQESFYPESTSEVIAQRTGARLVRIPGGPDARRGETYRDFMNGVVRLLRGAAR